MLCVPILLLLPFALRAGVRSRHWPRPGRVCWRSSSAVEVLTLSRSGLLGLACGLLVLAWPLRRQLLQPRFVAPVAGALGLLALALASSSYVRQAVRSRVTLSDNPPRSTSSSSGSCSRCSTRTRCFGLGLNTFSVYYQFLTGKTNWGPHSLDIALLDETGPRRRACSRRSWPGSASGWR